MIPRILKVLLTNGQWHDYLHHVNQMRQYQANLQGMVTIQGNTDYAGLEISVISHIASLFSRQIANVNAGPILALESMGAKLLTVSE